MKKGALARGLRARSAGFTLPEAAGSVAVRRITSKFAVFEAGTGSVRLDSKKGRQGQWTSPKGDAESASLAVP